MKVELKNTLCFLFFFSIHWVTLVLMMSSLAKQPYQSSVLCTLCVVHVVHWHRLEKVFCFEKCDDYM